MNDTISLLRRHRSIRHYEPVEVSDEHIAEAVRAGQAASTSAAVQAYCMIRIRDAEIRQQLVGLAGDQEKVARAGAFFVICADVRRHRLAARAAGQPYEARLEAFLVAVIDAALFAQNAVIAFESLGYGVCYIGGIRNSLPAIDRLLELPEGVYPLFGLCVGVPGEDPAPRPRLPLDAVLFEGCYPDDEHLATLLAAYDDTYGAYTEQRGKGRQSWTGIMAGKFISPRRTDLAAFYQGKGADLT